MNTSLVVFALALVTTLSSFTVHAADVSSVRVKQYKISVSEKNLQATESQLIKKGLSEAKKEAVLECAKEMRELKSFDGSYLYGSFRDWEEYIVKNGAISIGRNTPTRKIGKILNGLYSGTVVCGDSLAKPVTEVTKLWENDQVGLESGFYHQGRHVIVLNVFHGAGCPKSAVSYEWTLSPIGCSEYQDILVEGGSKKFPSVCTVEMKERSSNGCEAGTTSTLEVPVADIYKSIPGANDAPFGLNKLIIKTRKFGTDQETEIVLSPF